MDKHGNAREGRFAAQDNVAAALALKYKAELQQDSNEFLNGKVTSSLVIERKCSLR